MVLTTSYKKKYASANQEDIMYSYSNFYICVAMQQQYNGIDTSQNHTGSQQFQQWKRIGEDEFNDAGESFTGGFPG